MLLFYKTFYPGNMDEIRNWEYTCIEARLLSTTLFALTEQGINISVHLRSRIYWCDTEPKILTSLCSFYRSIWFEEQWEHIPDFFPPKANKIE